MPRQNTFEDDSLASEVVFEKLVIEEDSDHIIQDLERLPFVQIKVLGLGLSASVDEVRYTHTGAVFARKTITFPGLKDREAREEYFNNEVSIMRSLKGHRHIIKLYATWVWKKQFGLILDPAANGGSLDHYLVNYWEALEKPKASKMKIETMRMALERAFGCLANGLAYIHKHGIRHRDIKPPNILMHDHSVIITDFGASKDTIQTGENTTEGPVDQQTRKYSAPEVFDGKKRSFEADVYSLGCVYIELLSILSKAIQNDMKLPFSKIMDDLHAEILGVELPSRLEFLRSIILSMTSKNRESRVKITSIAADICQQDGFHCDECIHVPEPAQSYSSYSEWVYDAEQQLHYCYMLDEEGKEIGYIWEGDPPTMDFHSFDGPRCVLPPSLVLFCATRWTRHGLRISCPSFLTRFSSSDDTQSNATESEHGAPYLLSALRPLLPSVVSGEDIESEFSKVLVCRNFTHLTRMAEYRRVRKSSHAEFFVLGRVSYC
jgi:serine/threonine protein kinase